MHVFGFNVMPIVPKFNRNDVRKALDENIEAIEQMEINYLNKLGEACIIESRNLSPEIGFHDQTGALRSSIGYAVFHNGVAIHFDFDYTKSAEGVKYGRNLANKIGTRVKNGICLVVVAGMNYAQALEANGAMKVKSKRSYVVLSSAEELAKREFPKIVKKILTNITKAIE
jgi:hypothetical protein